jgi:hypothetical protein
MINDAVDFIRRELINHLGVASEEVIAGNVHVLKERTARGVYVSLVNVEEECTLKNTRHFVKKTETTDPRYIQPPMYFNLYVLFAFDFEDYETSLLRMSQTIELFQSKPVFTAGTASVTFPNSLEKLIFDIYNLNFEHLNHLWSVLGSTYFPSILFKVRLVKVQLDVSVPAPPIDRVLVKSMVTFPPPNDKGDPHANV